MILSVVKELSRLRSRVFNPTPEYKDKVIWSKAQKLQEHIYSAGKNIYVFVNRHYFEEVNGKITKPLIEKHLKSFINSKSFSEFIKRRIFYIYDEEAKACECKTFWHLGYCKHYLAVKIFQKKITVKIYYLFFFHDI